MDVRGGNPCALCIIWFLMNVLSKHLDYGSHGFVAADDRPICDRSGTDISTEIVVNTGDTLTLSCLTDGGRDGPEITFYPDNQLVSVMIIVAIDDPRYVVMSFEDEGDTCTSKRVTIVNVNESDQGMYECRVSGNENGTMYVRVAERMDKPMFTRATQTLRVAPILPLCSMNFTSDDVLEPNDLVAFTCTTGKDNVPAGTQLDWVGKEDAQMRQEGGLTATLVDRVSSALQMPFTCVSSCNQSRECDDTELAESKTCEAGLLQVNPVGRVFAEGDNATFECTVNLNGYNTKWFLPGPSTLGSLEQSRSHSFENRTTTITLFNVTTYHSTQTLLCNVRRNKGESIAQKSVTLMVSHGPSDVLLSSVAPTPGPNSRGTVDVTITTPRQRSISIYIGQRQTNKPPTNQISSPLDLNLILAIAICGASAIIILVVALSCVIFHRRQRNKDQAIDINPVFAFGDMSNDAPVNLDVHFNVYTQHVFDETPRSMEAIRRDNSIRMSEVTGRPGNGNRVTSFHPTSNTLPNPASLMNNAEDDQPGKNLSYYVENDVYVSYSDDYA